MNPGTLKALFIINPILEKKTGKNISGLIGRYLATGRIEPTIIYSDFPGNAKDLAEHNVGKYQVIVAGGGDGTINEVSQSLINTETILGILPLGSGKGLARTLGIPMDIINAIKTINELNTVRIDSGMAGNHRFFSIAGIGLAAEVAHAYAGSSRRGFFPYALNLVKKLPGYSPISVKITAEDRIISGRYFDITIANARQWGYGAQISPKSKPDDGWLDICLLRDFPKILVPCLLARLFMRSIHHSKYMEAIPVKSAEISGKGPFKGHIDGEPVEFTLPLKISIMPGSLKVIVRA